MGGRGCDNLILWLKSADLAPGTHGNRQGAGATFAQSLRRGEQGFKGKILSRMSQLGRRRKKTSKQKTHKLCRAGKCSVKDWGLQKAVAQYSRHSVWMRWQQELMLAIPGDSKA